jgi:hypothetical protein
VHKASGSDAAPKAAWRNWRIAGCLVQATVMAACGGGKSDGGGSSQPLPQPVVEKPASRAEAARFLTQATFGPTDAEVDHPMSVGYSAWIDEQFAKPASSNLALWDAKATANNATPNTAQDGTTHAFWRNAISGDDQLRQRWMMGWRGCADQGAFDGCSTTAASPAAASGRQPRLLG